MNRIGQGLRFACAQLKLEFTSIRVIMGYLFGLAIVMYFLQSIMQYVTDTGQPVNVLEAFIVVEHQVRSILFLVPGWLLVVEGIMYIISFGHAIVEKVSVFWTVNQMLMWENGMYDERIRAEVLLIILLHGLVIAVAYKMGQRMLKLTNF